MTKVWIFALPFVSTTTAQSHPQRMDHGSYFHSDSAMARVSPPPDCWVAAMQAMQQLGSPFLAHGREGDFEHENDTPLGMALCAAMTYDQQKSLALELARCQTEDMQRDLFLDAPNHKCNHKPLSLGQLPQCLSLLTDAGVNSYTHFFTYVNQACTRITQGLVTMRQEQTSLQLQQAAEAASQQLEWIVAKQEELWKQADEREQDLLSTHTEIISSLVKQQESILQDQSKQLMEHEMALNDFQHNIWATTDQREKLRAKQQEEWLHQQQLILEGQEAKMTHHQQQLLDLTKTVGDAAEKMKPLLGIDSLLSLATNGLTWLTSLAQFLGMINLIWLLTLFKRQIATRRYMFAILLAQIFLEFVMHWMVIKGLLSPVDRDRGIRIVRSWTLTLECCAYITGFFLSFFRSKQDDSREGWNDASHHRIEIIRLLEESVAKQRAEAMEREERILQMWSQRMQQHATANPPTTLSFESNVLSLPPLYQQRQSEGVVQCTTPLRSGDQRIKLSATNGRIHTETGLHSTPHPSIVPPKDSDEFRLFDGARCDEATESALVQAISATRTHVIPSLVTPTRVTNPQQELGRNSDAIERNPSVSRKRSLEQTEVQTDSFEPEIKKQKN